MTDIETPPVPQAALLPSSREVWPKTEQERKIAKGLIKEAFGLAGNDHAVIAWGTIKEKHPALWEQLMYWSADEVQRLHSTTNHMRKSGELPQINGTARFVGRPQSVRDKAAELHAEARFEAVDKWLIKKSENFPRNNTGIIWREVMTSYPVKWVLVEKTWPGCDVGRLIQNLSARYRHLNLRAPKASGQPTPKAQKAAKGIRNTTKQNLALRIIEAGKGKHSYIHHVKDHRPDLWAEAEKIWPVNTESRVKYSCDRIKDNERKGHRPAAPVTALQEQVKTVFDTAQIRTSQVAENKWTQVRWQYCPLCMSHLPSQENVLQRPLETCLKCGYPVMLAEQGALGRLIITL